jgi:hypothetical protein
MATNGCVSLYKRDVRHACVGAAIELAGLPRERRVVVGQRRMPQISAAPRQGTREPE